MRTKEEIIREICLYGYELNELICVEGKYREYNFYVIDEDCIKLGCNPFSIMVRNHKALLNNLCGELVIELKVEVLKLISELMEVLENEKGSN